MRLYFRSYVYPHSDLNFVSCRIEEEHHTLSALRAELQEAAHSLRQEHSDTKTIVELSRLQDRCLHLETELKETKNQLFTSSVNLVSYVSIKFHLWVKILNQGFH